VACLFAGFVWVYLDPECPSLAEHLGAIAAGIAEGGARSVVASYLGRIAEHDTRVLTLAILKGILGGTMEEPVTFVNAPMLARDRGLTVSEMRSIGWMPSSPTFGLRSAGRSTGQRSTSPPPSPPTPR